ncbi:adhesion G-protein coupled receptor F1 [Etheostoma cragini]|uniref:adhesion G-protein coupled receptor F1 n=1 Tax=Etheostoma cragini TaxID=417921 RepID=UPI00155F2731|nr:adhesion G-protein coupled receptor F1 [Etheostoma cragini]
MILSAKPRETMCSKMLLLFLIGAVYVTSQMSSAVEEVYIADLMVESNVTLDSLTILNALSGTIDLKPTYDALVSLLDRELVAECLIIGTDTQCNCSAGYIWSNHVCYNFNCCRESTCTKNVSYIEPLCIAKVQVRINGSVIKSNIDKHIITSQLQNKFGELNGFESLNVTGQRLSKFTDFEAAVSVKFNTSKLQKIVTDLESALGAALWVDTSGMVNIESPKGTVRYESEPELKCTFEEASGSAGWNMSTPNQRFELNTGSVVKLNPNCVTETYKSCVAVTLQKVTGVWSGTYECGFTTGSVRHTARAQLNVALLPDVIALTINPLTADCSAVPNAQNIKINVTATIANSTESFVVWWSSGDERKDDLNNQTNGDNLVYNFNAIVSCQKTEFAQYVNVTFNNTIGQTRSARVDLPVIYEGAPFCKEEWINKDFWPKTPEGNTVINRTCEVGRVGYKSRTCKDGTWRPVFYYCIDENLNKVLDAADNFRKGLGATQGVAKDIFAGLKNSSTAILASNSSNSMGDIGASIDVLNVMSSGSKNVALQEDLLPDFVNAASNMLTKTWGGLNDTLVRAISSTYLKSVEGLVKNIHVNTSKGMTDSNLDLKFCSGSDCNISVFDTNVSLNKTNGIMKTVAVKNLMDKLGNNINQTDVTSLLISTTLQDNNDLSIGIRLEFPQQLLNPKYKPLCVFWDTTDSKWSSVGCTANSSDENRIVCECNHLTSFSVLMSKSSVSDKILDMITNVGIGVSICSLLIFLIIESLVWSAVVKTNLSHFRHTAIVNIAVFLLLGDCSFLANIILKNVDENWCLFLTVCKHLFFLAMFSWMLCMSVMLVHQLIFVFSPLRKRVFMFLSSIVGYVCPMLIVGCSYVYCKYTKKPYYSKDSCWLVYESLLVGSIHAFILPIGTVILTNLFSMVVVMLTLLKSSAPEGSKANDRETAKSILKVVVFLTPVFGVTWVFGFGLLLLENNTIHYTIVNYSFTILNSFQGLFLLITGVFAEQKVREEIFKIIVGESKRKTETTKNLNSTTYTKDK